MYRPPAQVAGQTLSYAEYLARRNPVLGWPYPSELGGDTYGRDGARPSPAFPETDPIEISLYGDSFTHSYNADDETWGNVLSGLVGARVGNFGVGGYGSDQAYLRFLNNDDDPASIIVLSHLSEDVIRNLCRNRDLLTGTAWYAYKPRFVLDEDGELVLVPIPTLTENEHLRLLGRRKPQLVLPNESFAPGGRAGSCNLEFPYTYSILANFGGFRMRAKLAGRASYAEFYAKDHPLAGVRISAAICRAFGEEAKRRKKRSLIMLLPTIEDLRHFRDTGEWYYANLGKQLQREGVAFIDFGPRLSERIGSSPIESFFDKTNHYAPVADRLLAEFVHEHLRSLKWLPIPR